MRNNGCDNNNNNVILSLNHDNENDKSTDSFIHLLNECRHYKDLIEKKESISSSLLSSLSLLSKKNDDKEKTFVESNFLHFIRSNQYKFIQQFQQYVQHYESATTTSSSYSDTFKKKKEDIKTMILNTRYVLRLGLCCLSIDHNRTTTSISSSSSSSSTSHNNNHSSCTLRQFLQNDFVIGYTPRSITRDDDDPETKDDRNPFLLHSIDTRWHVWLVRIIRTRNLGGDIKCQLYAAQLLSNLVTANYNTTKQVVSYLNQFVPSEKVIQKRLLHNMMMEDHQDHDNNTTTKNIHNPCSEEEEDEEELNWLDLFLQHKQSTGNNNNSNNKSHDDRLILGVLVACLYNCVCSISLQIVTTTAAAISVAKVETVTSETTPSNDNNDDFVIQFIPNLVQSKLLISTLLRQVITKDTLIQTLSSSSLLSKTTTSLSSIRSSTDCMKNLKEDDDGSSNVNGITMDETTEWILHLIHKLCHLGYFPIMYESIGVTETSPGLHMDNNDLQSMNQPLHLLPEQLILLHAIQSEITLNTNNSTNHNTCEFFGPYSSSSSSSCTDERLHGMIESCSSENQWIASYLFLCQLYVHYRRPIIRSMAGGITDDTGIELNDLSLLTSAQDTILGILAHSLIHDTEPTVVLRSEIGTKTQSLQCLIIDLGQILDTIQQANHHVVNKSRDYVFPEPYQRFCTLAVQVIGNLCYRCTDNQNLLRLTIIPTTSTGDNELKTPTNPSDNSNEHSFPNKQQEQQRNGLHVLLSTTAISHSCFTLREWSVLAIRYALDHNTKNQEVVAELETQQAIQSSILNDLGIQVEFDKTKGKVNITTI